MSHISGFTWSNFRPRKISFAAALRTRCKLETKSRTKWKWLRADLLYMVRDLLVAHNAPQQSISTLQITIHLRKVDASGRKVARKLSAVKEVAMTHRWQTMTSTSSDFSVHSRSDDFLPGAISVAIAGCHDYTLDDVKAYKHR